MDHTASRIKLLETIMRAARAETTALPTASVKHNGARAAVNAPDHPRAGWLFKALEPGCFLADRWLG